MERVSAKKGFSAVMFMLAVLFACLSIQAMTAKADEKVVLTTENFNIVNGSDSYIDIQISMPYSDVYGEVQILDSNMNVVATKDSYSPSQTVYVPFSSAKNKIYYYRVIPFSKAKSTDPKTYVGDASPMKAYSTIMLKDVSSKRQKSLKLKCPKLPNLKNIKVMMSKSRSTGFKKIATIKAGKTSKTITKFNGKAFALYTNYYFYPKVTLKNGVPCVNIKEQYTYFTRTWR